MMNYFGCLDQVEFDELSTEVKQETLLEMGIFEKQIVVPLNINLGNSKNRITNDHSKNEVTQGVISDLYSFVLNTLEKDIEHSQLDFHFNFKSEIYGLDIKDQKKIALSHFNVISEPHLSNNIQLYKKVKSSHGIELIESDGKLSQLYDRQKALKSQLVNTDLFDNYLFGINEVFQAFDFHELEVIAEIRAFEADLKILVSLNDRFGFEDDIYFSNLSRLKENFLSKYNSIFNSFEAYNFAHLKIEEINNHHNAQIESLYQAMSDTGIIKKNASEFLRFINYEYGFSITKIRSYEREFNRTHDERVTQFSLEWDQFASNN